MRHRTALAALLAGLALAGCAGKPAAPSAAPTPPPSATLREVEAPAFRSRELTLPVRCSPGQHTARLAAYGRSTKLDYPSGVLGLLDLRSGRYSEVVTVPVSSTERFEVLGHAVSDTWLAWQEVGPGEKQWRAYVAPVDAERLTVGRPVLVDHALTHRRSRPHLALTRDTLAYAVSEQTSAGPAAVLHAVDLPGGQRRTVWRTTETLYSMRLDGRTALVLTRNRQETSAALHAVSIDDGHVLSSTPLDAIGAASDFADAEGDLTVWAAFEARTLPWPAVYARRGVSTVCLDRLGCDPTIRGGRVFYESYDKNGEDAGVFGADPARGEVFRLIGPNTDGFTAWQIAARPSDHGGTLVAWLDESGRDSDEAEQVTRVMVWETGSAP